MPRLPAKSYSYRSDPNVPRFDYARALLLLDGLCVLCTSGRWFLLRNNADVVFASSQS